MRGMLRDTISELIDRKAIWGYLALTVLGVTVVVLAGRFVDTTRPDTFDLKNAADSAAETARRLHSGIFTLGALLVFLSVMFTAGVFPNMLERGRAEFYLSKPLARTNLYLMKLAAVWLVYSGLIIACLASVYLAGAVTFGLFDIRILYLFGLVLFSMALWLSITGLLGVVTGSTLTVVTVTILTWTAQAIVAGHDKMKEIVTSAALRTVIDAIYYVLPKDSEVGSIEQSLAAGGPVEDWLPLWSTALFCLLMLFLGLQIFKRKSY
jgi:hypothetical protein